MVATEGHEVGLAGLVKPFQSPLHEASLRRENSPTQAEKKASVGHPRSDFGVRNQALDM
jgi:hypothetical protein